jgi:hypothetical protein
LRRGTTLRVQRSSSVNNDCPTKCTQFSCKNWHGSMLIWQWLWLDPSCFYLGQLWWCLWW